MNRVVVIGGRGYTGSELVPLVWRHPELNLLAVGSSSAAGKGVSGLMRGMEDCPLKFADLQADQVGNYPADVYILALLNGHAESYVAAIEASRPDAIIVDMSADYRFDPEWTYGLPEVTGNTGRERRKIANPGCYATAFQLILAPLRNELADTPVGFGVSGYSGAGRKPCRRNDTEALKDNLMPYALTNHIHEREVSYHAGQQVRFLPHVASFFRGINLTAALKLRDPSQVGNLAERYAEFYEGKALVSVRDEIPEVAQVAGRHGAIIGGFAESDTDPGAVSVVCVLDNLLKGAATQAIQNINLALGLNELAGIPV